MISVIIPTRDRPAGLARTLASLARMAVPPGLCWEVIVVDNGRYAAARAVAAAVSLPDGVALHVVDEPAPGVSRARNRGLETARGEILAFTDDDVEVDAAWLAELHREFAADPGIGMVTGQVVVHAPDGTEGRTRGGAERTVLRFPANPRPVAFGGNMAVRAETVAQVGGFDERLGPGPTAWGGEDVDYVYRVLAAGYAVAYSPRVLVVHRPAGPRSDRLPYGWGAVLAKHALAGDRWMARLLGIHLWRLLRALVQPHGRGRARAARRLLALLRGAGWWLWGAVWRRTEPPRRPATAASGTGAGSSGSPTSPRISPGWLRRGGGTPPR